MCKKHGLLALFCQFRFAKRFKLDLSHTVSNVFKKKRSVKKQVNDKMTENLDHKELKSLRSLP